MKIRNFKLAISHFILLLAFMFISPLAMSQSVGYGLKYSKPITLESGKLVTTLGDQIMHFSESTPAWLLYYETEIDVSDLEALERESREVFDFFRDKIKEKEVANVLICSRKRTSNSGSVINSSNGYNFLFKKKEDETWDIYKE